MRILAELWPQNFINPKVVLRIGPRTGVVRFGVKMRVHLGDDLVSFIKRANDDDWDDDDDDNGDNDDGDGHIRG